MNVAIKVFTLAAMIRVLIATDKPWLCAVICTGVAFLINMTTITNRAPFYSCGNTADEG